MQDILALGDPIRDLHGAFDVGGVFILRSGIRCMITSCDHSVIHCDFPGQKYGRWWSRDKPSVTGLPEYDVMQYLPPNTQDHRAGEDKP